MLDKEERGRPAELLRNDLSALYQELPNRLKPMLERSTAKT